MKLVPNEERFADEMQAKRDAVLEWDQAAASWEKMIGKHLAARAGRFAADAVLFAELVPNFLKLKASLADKLDRGLAYCELSDIEKNGSEIVGAARAVLEYCNGRYRERVVP